MRTDQDGGRSVRSILCLELSPVFKWQSIHHDAVMARTLAICQLAASVTKTKAYKDAFLSWLTVLWVSVQDHLDMSAVVIAGICGIDLPTLEPGGGEDRKVPR